MNVETIFLGYSSVILVSEKRVWAIIYQSRETVIQYMSTVGKINQFMPYQIAVYYFIRVSFLW